MQDFREFFLNQFDKAVSKGIIEFGKRLSVSKSDVFILMARKAACFVECLEELSLTRLNGHVTTDRVLDMNLSWLKGKTVTIVDDAIVSGTTIFETINVLQKAGVASIEVLVICVNDAWFTKELLIDERGNDYLQEPFMRLKNEDCIKLCSDIVTALSIFPRPYSVDFPIYKDARIPENAMDQVLLSSYWECDDISSAVQSENNVISLTLTPSELCINMLDEALGFPFSKVSMSKIRLYGFLKENPRDKYSRNRTNTLKTRNFYNVKILPLTVLKPIEINDIDALFSSIAGHFNEFSEILNHEFISATSRLRLIQHLVASYLGRHWEKSISHYTTSRISLSQDRRAFNFLYPPHVVEAITQIVAGDLAVFKNVKYKPIDLGSLNQYNEFKSSVSGSDPLSAVAKLTEPFLFLYHSKELIARKEVKKLQHQVFNTPLYKDLMSRLKKGFSLNYLLEIIKDDFSSREADKIVSLFLDRSIDKGIVVPITGVKDGVLFRAYRHGEDVIFGEMEEKLCLVMFKIFLKVSGRTALPHLLSEKLLVLLLKIGVQRGFLREFIYDNSPRELTRIVSVKNYKFGQITKQQNLKPDSALEPVYVSEDQKSEWLTSVLLSKKLLSKEKITNYYTVPDINTNDIDSKALYETENIGELFGQLDSNRKNKTQPSIGEKDLVRLTSCLNPNDIAASMSAEIFIFKEKWPAYKLYMTRSITPGKHDNIYKIMSDLRNDDSWTAINSGQDKFKDYKNREGHKIIDLIGKSLTGITARTWMQFWSVNLEWKESEISDQLKNVLQEEAIWLFETNILMRLLEILLCKMLNLSGMDLVIILQLHSELNEHRELKKGYQAEERKIVLDSNNKTQQDHIKLLKERIRKIGNRINTINKEIKHLNNWVNLVVELNTFTDDLFDYTDNYSYELKSIVQQVKESINEQTEAAFVEKKLINKIARELDKKAIDAHLILEKIDLIVSTFGKVNHYYEYTDAVFVDITYSTDFERVKLEKLLLENLTNFEKEIFRYKALPGQTPSSFHLLPAHKNVWGKGFIIIGRGMLASSRLIELQEIISRKLIAQQQSFKLFFFPNLPKEMTFSIQAKNNTMLAPGFFFTKAQAIIDTIRSNPTDLTLYVCLSDSIQHEEFEKLIPEKSGNYFQSIIEDLPKTILKFQPAMINKTFDIGIITIVAPEYQAIAKIMESSIEEKSKISERYYQKGMLLGDDVKHSVVMGQQLIQGNESVSELLRDMEEEFKPKLMILFGIGGSITEDLTIGDVCIGNQIIDYTKVKVKDQEEISHRGSTYRIEPTIQVLLNRFFNKYNEVPKFKSSPNGFSDLFKVISGPIGSGNAVIGSSSAEIKRWLLSYNTKCALVETEALGFSHSDYERKLRHDYSIKSSLIIRGVSDQADVNKDDKWRTIAADNAAITLTKLIELMPQIN